MTNKSDETEFHVELIAPNKTYTLAEVCRMCQLDADDITIYIEHGIVIAEHSDESLFSHIQVERLQCAKRLQNDLEVNHAGAALALDLLDTIARLQRDLLLLQR